MIEKCCLEKRLIGEILVSRQMVTAAQLDEALRVQRTQRPGVFLGEVLIQLGYVSDIDIVTALVLQCNLPYIAVSKHEIAREVLALVPAEVARREKVVPLDRIGSVLSLVMHNPIDAKLREDLERATGCQIAVFISTRGEIERALERFYG
jgi:type IV pilus assembly protein PilB